jgi:4-diphosphocytidyl-2-C-methyl-D-erythritol kinase
MVLRAYAKINLGLRILGKRKDGFHDIETIFHRIDLFDELTLEASDHSISITSAGRTVPLDENNLCWKAVELLRNEVGTTRGANLHLKKRIPVGAGLGGGSSDAAAILTALPSLWQLSIDTSTLARVALAIGSDVSFFLHNRSAYAVGRGEQLSFVKISFPYWIVVVTPNIHVSTRWAYSQVPDENAAGRRAGTFYDGGTCSVAAVSILMENDFEEAVFAAYPEIGSLKRDLLAGGAAYALLSGSGSSVFGLFDDEADARLAEKLFRTNCFVSVTPPNFTPTL